MSKPSIYLISIFLFFTCVFAEVSITGDARVRPRLDIMDNGAYGIKSEDFYYYYRARILIAADIGDGYFFNTRLGHNGTTSKIGEFGTGLTPSSTSVPGAGRGSVDFMEMYFGHTGEKFGWSAGIIPITHNPLLDIHYYPSIILDKPWDTYNNNAAHGFNLNYKFAGQKIDLKLLVDNNEGKKIVDAFFVETSDTSYGYAVDSLGHIVQDTTISLSTAADSKTKDQYTMYLSYPISLMGLKMTPQFLMTLADAGNPAPMTYGAELNLPKVAGFSVSAFAGLTNQSVTDSLIGTAAYKGWISRIKLVGKLGPGTLVASYDMANTTPDIVAAVSSKFTYLWLSYSYTLHKSEKGSLVLAPTYRLYTNKIEGSREYNRAKIELTTQITFK